MDIALGQQTPVGVFFQDSDGPMTGLADVVLIVTDRSTGLVAFTDVCSEDVAGSGYYSTVIPYGTLTTPGWVLASFVSVAGGVSREDFLQVGVIPAYAETKRDVRQQIARLLDGQDAVYDVTADDGTTTTAVIGQVTLGGNMEYAGMWALFADRGNTGVVRRVTGYDHDASEFTFAPALPSAVLADDRIELYRIDPRIINNAINSSYASVADEALVYVADRTLATDGSTTEFSLPTGIRKIARIGLNDPSIMGSELWLHGMNWELRPGGKLIIGGRGYTDNDPFRWNVATLTPIRSGAGIWIEGWASLEPPLYDDGYVTLSPAYVAAHAHFSISRQRPETAQVWPFLKRLVDEERKRAIRTVVGRQVS